ncbi:MAG: rRNA pseudouridine synthase [Lactobacillus sp.]|jgi:23S rRNA pseudouridine2605 synthase|nr:rRNA pseudouridine synthase [Lactobacillus sp.]
MAERLQKVIAAAGITSRRKAEQLILAGRVSVDGQKVTKLGTKVEPKQEVAVDGVPIKAQALHTYLFYKPRGIISAVSDNHGRQTVADYFADLPYRLYPVGRLDYDTSGLLLMTDDGELANHLMHPRNEVPKVYVAKIEGALTGEAIHALKTGVQLKGRKASPAKVKILKTKQGHRTSQIVQLTIHEGHYHQVKLMLQAVGCPVQKLSRPRYAFLDLHGLSAGQYRELSPQEVDKLRHL